MVVQGFDNRIVSVPVDAVVLPFHLIHGFLKNSPISFQYWGLAGASYSRAYKTPYSINWANQDPDPGSQVLGCAAVTHTPHKMQTPKCPTVLAFIECRWRSHVKCDA
jgi:hypothetical protein